MQGLWLSPIVASVICSGIAAASVTPVPPFTGDVSESFETFQNYVENPAFYEPEPIPTFGGFATLVNSGVVAIYEPGAAEFNLGSPGVAGVVDGMQGCGLNADEVSGLFTFDAPICAFGGWWAAAVTGQFDGIITVEFIDVNGDVVDTAEIAYADEDGDQTADLIWAGWESDVPLAAVRYAGDFVVLDAVQVRGGACLPPPVDCPEDVDGNGVVDMLDLKLLLAAWGVCDGPAVCDAGFICGGLIEPCPSSDLSECFCFTGFDGDVICGLNANCADLAICPDGVCPPGTQCAIDTCCANPVCLPVCDDRNVRPERLRGHTARGFLGPRGGELGADD